MYLMHALFSRKGDKGAYTKSLKYNSLMVFKMFIGSEQALITTLINFSLCRKEDENKSHSNVLNNQMNVPKEYQSKRQTCIKYFRQCIEVELKL